MPPPSPAERARHTLLSEAPLLPLRRDGQSLRHTLREGDETSRARLIRSWRQALDALHAAGFGTEDAIAHALTDGDLVTLHPDHVWPLGTLSAHRPVAAWLDLDEATRWLTAQGLGRSDDDLAALVAPAAPPWPGFPAPPDPGLALVVGGAPELGALCAAHGLPCLGVAALGTLHDRVATTAQRLLGRALIGETPLLLAMTPDEPVPSLLARLETFPNAILRANSLGKHIIRTPELAEALGVDPHLTRPPAFAATRRMAPTLALENARMADSPAARVHAEALALEAALDETTLSQAEGVSRLTTLLDLAREAKDRQLSQRTLLRRALALWHAEPRRALTDLSEARRLGTTRGPELAALGAVAHSLEAIIEALGRPDRPAGPRDAAEPLAHLAHRLAGPLAPNLPRTGAPTDITAPSQTDLPTETSTRTTAPTASLFTRAPATSAASSFATQSTNSHRAPGATPTASTAASSFATPPTTAAPGWPPTATDVSAPALTAPPRDEATLLALAFAAPPDDARVGALALTIEHLGLRALLTGREEQLERTLRRLEQLALPAPCAPLASAWIALLAARRDARMTCRDRLIALVPVLEKRRDALGELAAERAALAARRTELDGLVATMCVFSHTQSPVRRFIEGGDLPWPPDGPLAYLVLTAESLLEAPEGAIRRVLPRLLALHADHPDLQGLDLAVGRLLARTDPTAARTLLLATAHGEPHIERLALETLSTLPALAPDERDAIRTRLTQLRGRLSPASPLLPPPPLTPDAAANQVLGLLEVALAGPTTARWHHAVTALLGAPDGNPLLPPSSAALGLQLISREGDRWTLEALDGQATILTASADLPGRRAPDLATRILATLAPVLEPTRPAAETPTRPPPEQMDRDLAAGRLDFFDDLVPAFKQHELTIDELRATLHLGLLETRGLYRSLAARWRIDDYRRFMDFLRRNDAQLDYRPYRRGEPDWP